MTASSTNQDSRPVENMAASVDIQKNKNKNKKRRLSKQERKAFKKKKKQQQQQQQQLKQDDNNDAVINDKKLNDEELKETDLEQEQEHKKSEQTASNNDDQDEEEERIHRKCLQSYIPIDIPKQPSVDLLKVNNSKGNTNNSRDTTIIADEGGCRTLGKWFPNAIFIKSSINYTNTGKLVLLNDGQNNHNSLKEQDIRVDNPKSSLVLFYQYTTSADSKATTHWTHQQLQLLMTFLSNIARRRNLGGRIRVAPEGVNATISAVDTKQVSAIESIRHFAYDLQNFDSKVFANTDFKYFDHLPADRHFKEFKILPVQELVFYDIGEDEAPLINQQKRQQKQQQQQQQKGEASQTSNSSNAEGGGVHLEAKEYHKMLQKDNTVVIGTYNSQRN